MSLILTAHGVTHIAVGIYGGWRSRSGDFVFRERCNSVFLAPTDDKRDETFEIESFHPFYLATTMTRRQRSADKDVALRTS